MDEILIKLLKIQHEAKKGALNGQKRKGKSIG